MRQYVIYETRSTAGGEIMDRKFEKFLGGPVQPTQERIYVSINPSNLITLNKRCYELLGKPAAAHLHFSRADDVIAVQPVSSSRIPTAFPFKQSPGGGRRIFAASFCQHFNIKTDTTERFVDPEISDGVLYLKLSQTVTVRNSKRRRQNQAAK